MRQDEETGMPPRDEILARLRAAAGDRTPPPLPPPWRSRHPDHDLVGRFSQALTAAHGEVRRVLDVDAAADQLDGLLAELQAQHVVVNADPPVSDLDLAARWPAISWHLVSGPEGEWRRACAAADLGLSGAAAAIAQTGTVALHSGRHQSRLATLLPPVHVVLLPSSLLTPDLFTFTAARRAELPANLVFVSGPSKSADIEQTMAIGVHGPGRLVVILIENG